MHIQNVPRQKRPKRKRPKTKLPMDKTSQGTKRPTEQNVPRDKTSHRTFYLLGRSVIGMFFQWEFLSLGPYVWRPYVPGTWRPVGLFVLGHFVCAPCIGLQALQ